MNKKDLKKRIAVQREKDANSRGKAFVLKNIQLSINWIRVSVPRSKWIPKIVDLLTDCHVDDKQFVSQIINPLRQEFGQDIPTIQKLREMAARKRRA